MKQQTLYVALGGIVCGAVYFMCFEQFDTSKMPNNCWTILHYMNKQFSPLYAVHLKSILAGLALIFLAYDYPEIVVFIGASIIGLHLLQAYNELYIVKQKNAVQSIQSI